MYYFRGQVNTKAILLKPKQSRNNQIVILQHLKIIKRYFRSIRQLYQELTTEAYLEHSQKTTMKISCENVKGYKLLTIFAKKLHEHMSTFQRLTKIFQELNLKAGKLYSFKMGLFVPSN